MTRLLTGDVVEEDDRDQQIEALQDENRVLQAELTKAQRDSARALASLRRQLTPLYQALQAVFGELDAVLVADAQETVSPPASAAQDARVVAVWASWKSKLGQGPAKVIDSLLLHGEMNTQQLAIATGYHRHTVPNHIHRLHQAGLVNKNGGRFSLKQLG